MKKYVDESQADKIVDYFWNNICWGTRKLKITECKFNKECGNSAKCLVKYILKNYDVYEK